MHGGGAPQVKKAAELRLLELVDPALARIKVLIDHGENDAVKLAASKDVLDRTGFSRKEKQEIEHKGGVTVYLPARKATE